MDECLMFLQKEILPLEGLTVSAHNGNVYVNDDEGFRGFVITKDELAKDNWMKVAAARLEMIRSMF